MRLLLAVGLLAGPLFPQSKADPATPAEGAAEQAAEQEEPGIPRSALGAFKFRGIGPALCSGRITDFAVDPTDHSRWFIATAAGGVWRTTNNGTTFDAVFAGEGSFSIGCVTLDPNNRHVVWVGSGENNSQRSVSWGDGVYRSLDGGKSWKNMGLANSEHIGRIAVDPRDSNVVWVAAQGPLWNDGGDRGVYKTTDGGETWEQVLAISEKTGANEIHLDPRNPDVAYASAYQRRRHVWTLINGGPESGVYKTTDGGKSWRKINRGLPGGDKGRIGMAISPVNPDVLYAIVEAQRGGGGFYRSTDRGESWSRMSGKVASSPQYYQEILCDPEDVDTIYCLDTRTSRSTDGGRTWSSIGNRDRHVDDHALWVDPSDTRHLLIGGDGGIYETFDGGSHWDFKENLSLAQYYRVSADMAEPFYNIYGGTQDNNSHGGPSRTRSRAGVTSEDWFVTVGGDGYETQVDYTDHNIIYAQWQYGGLVRYDRRSGETTDIKPRQAPGEQPIVWNWDSPLLISSHSHTRLYFAGDRLFRSDDRGDSWSTISGDLTRGIDRDQLEVMGEMQFVDAVAKNASTSVYGNCVSLTESPIDENLLYAGTDDGLIHVTTDSGSSWAKMGSFPGIPEMTYVSRLEASRHQRDRIYAAFNNHKKGDFKPYLLVSEDRGATWSSITDGLPEGHVVWSLAEDHENENLLFCGTEYGVFVSFDRGGKWTQMKSGLPTIPVRDIEIQRRENDLILGTFGRGFYVLDDYAPLREMTPELFEQPAHMFAVRTAPLYIEWSRLGGRGGRGSQGSTYFSAPNPPFGAMISWHMKDSFKTLKQEREAAQSKARKSGDPMAFPTDAEMRAEMLEDEPKVRLTIRDDAGNVVRRMPVSRSKGVRRVAWDLRYSGANPVQVGGSTRDSGPLVLSGRYTATLESVVGEAVEQLAEPVSFDVEALNLATLGAEDRAAALAFQQKVIQLRRAVRAAGRVMGELEDRVAHVRAAIRFSPGLDQGLLAQAEALDAELEQMRMAMSGDSSLSRRNKPAPLSISARINNVAGNQLSTSSAPTQTERDAYGFAADAFEPLLARLRTIATRDLPALEVQLERAGAGDTPGRLPTWKR